MAQSIRNWIVVENVAVAGDFESRVIVVREQRQEKSADGVVSKVRRNVTDAKPSIRGAIVDVGFAR